MKRSDKRGFVSPGLLKAGGIVLAVLIVGGTGAVLYHDRQTQAEYQAWARAENKKVFDQATQQRLSDQQLLSLERQLNASFYQRLQDHLPVRILVVGDGYGAGMGASSDARSWAQRLKTSISMKYGVTVELTNVSLTDRSGGFAAWASLHQQPDGAARGMLAEMVAAGTAEVDADGTIAPEGWNNTQSHAFRKDEYDLAVVSLGMTDDPTQFPIWYEAVLRGLRAKYRQCSVISLLSSQALTRPELGYADENADALRALSKQYYASTLDVGSAMLASDGSTQNASASDAADPSDPRIAKYTIDGLYLRDDGQTFLADALQKLIDQKVASAEAYTAGEVSLRDPAVEALDEFHYVPAEQLNRLNDYTYVLGKNQMRITDGAEETSGSILRHSAHVAGDYFQGIVGVDYMLTAGDNDLYLATGNGTKPFGRLTINNPYSTATHVMEAVNDHFSADRDGNLIISFGTKEQAAGLQGILFGGDIELPASLDTFKPVAYVGPTDENGHRLPLDDDGKVMETEAAPDEATEPRETIARVPVSTTQAADRTEASISATTADAQSTESGHDTGTTAGRAPKESTSASDAGIQEGASSTEGSSTSVTETTAVQPQGTRPGVIEVPGETSSERSEGKRVLTEEERLAILERLKSSEAAEG